MNQVSLSAQKGKRPPNRPLDRASIIAAALQLVRAEGTAALSMRRLAKELGTGAMSLYRHVQDRDDLLVGMLDHAATRLPIPAPNSNEKAEILALMRVIHSAFRKDPWIVGVLLYEGISSLHVLPFMDRIFAALDRMGLAPKEALEVYCLMLHYAYGESTSFETLQQRQQMKTTFTEAAAEHFPAAARAFAAAQDWQYDEFERNIERILKTVGP